MLEFMQANPKADSFGFDYSELQEKVKKIK